MNASLESGLSRQPKMANGRATWTAALSIAACTVLAMSQLQPKSVQAATFGTPKRIAGTTGADAEPPQLSVSGLNVYIVWHEFESSTSTASEIYFSRSTNSGGTYSSRVNLSSSAGISSSEEQIFSSGNNVFVVWTDDDLVQKKVYFRRSTDGGATFAAKKVMTDIRAPSNPRVTASGTNVIVAWQNEGSGGAQDIFIRQSTDTGTNFTAGKDITNNSSTSEFYFQDGGGLRQLAIIGSKIIVTWRDSAVSTAGLETFVIQGTL